jgi:hypothetical protein
MLTFWSFPVVMKRGDETISMKLSVITRDKESI